MKRILTLTLAVCLYAVSALASIEGAWTAEADSKRPDHFYIMMTRGRNHQMGTTMRISEFSGLTRAQIDGIPAWSAQKTISAPTGISTSVTGPYSGYFQIVVTSRSGRRGARRRGGAPGPRRPAGP